MKQCIKSFSHHKHGVVLLILLWLLLILLWLLLILLWLLLILHTYITIELTKQINARALFHRPLQNMHRISDCLTSHLSTRLLIHLLITKQLIERLTVVSFVRKDVLLTQRWVRLIIKYGLVGKWVCREWIGLGLGMH